MKGLGLAFFTALLLGVFLLRPLTSYGTKTQVTDTVKRSERICSREANDCKYLIFGEKETYQNTDSLWFGKFNSSDLYGEIDPKHTYRFTVTGWRIPYLSTYRNIVAVEKVK